MESTRKEIMFRRSIEMKVVKPKKEETPSSQPTRDIQETTAAVQAVATTIIRETGKVAFALGALAAVYKIAMTGFTQS
jgi:hypothetical protein